MQSKQRNTTLLTKQNNTIEVLDLYKCLCNEKPINFDSRCEDYLLWTNEKGFQLNFKCKTSLIIKDNGAIVSSTYCPNNKNSISLRNVYISQYSIDEIKKHFQLLTEMENIKNGRR